jgi:hypothetical protein
MNRVAENLINPLDGYMFASRQVFGFDDLTVPSLP